MTDATEIDDKDGVRLASLATRKFEFEDIVNADPLCPPSALKIVRVYLSFVGNFAEPVYASTIDLRVKTGLSAAAIVATRRKLVKLRYFSEAGKTLAGATRYKLQMERENIVLDHVAITAETLRRLDGDRKETQRRKRQSARVIAESEITPAAVIAESGDATEAVIAESGGPDEPRATKNCRPVIAENGDNYLEDSLDSTGLEEEARRSRAREDVKPKTSPPRWAFEFEGGS